MNISYGGGRGGEGGGHLASSNSNLKGK